MDARRFDLRQPGQLLIDQNCRRADLPTGNGLCQVRRLQLLWKQAKPIEGGHLLCCPGRAGVIFGLCRRRLLCRLAQQLFQVAVCPQQHGQRLLTAAVLLRRDSPVRVPGDDLQLHCRRRRIAGPSTDLAAICKTGQDRGRCIPAEGSKEAGCHLTEFLAGDCGIGPERAIRIAADNAQLLGDADIRVVRIREMAGAGGVQRLAHQFRKGMYHHLAHLLPGQPLGQVRALQRCREDPRLTGLLQLRQRPIIRLQSHRGQRQGRQQRQAEGQGANSMQSCFHTCHPFSSRVICTGQ